MLNKFIKLLASKGLKNEVIKKVIKRGIDFPFLSVLYSNIYTSRINKRIVSLDRKSVPVSIAIENTNICNTDCIMCPHRDMRRKKGIMDLSLYKRIIDQCASLKISEVVLSFFGEPLLDPALISKIRYAKDNGIECVTFATNGSLLDNTKALELLDSGVDVINISIDAATEQTFKKVKKNLDFEQVKKNVKNLIDLKKTKRKQYPFINIHFVVSEINAKEKNMFIKQWKGIADNAGLVPAFNRIGHSVEALLGNGRYRDSGYDSHRYPCPLLWYQIVLTWDGKAVLCCNDFDGQVIVGDVEKDNLKDIWQGDRLNKFKNMHQTNRINELKMCRDCLQLVHSQSYWWWLI